MSFEEEHHRIRAKAKLGLPLTNREIAKLVCLIMTDEEFNAILKLVSK